MSTDVDGGRRCRLRKSIPNAARCRIHTMTKLDVRAKQTPSRQRPTFRSPSRVAEAKALRREVQRCEALVGHYDRAQRDPEVARILAQTLW